MTKKILDWQNKEIVEIYDELPLWSAPFGNILLENIPLQKNWTVVDLGFGTGFPLIELAQRFGDQSKIIGVDIWREAMERAELKIKRLELANIEIINQKAEELSLDDESIDLVCSNLGINNFEDKAAVFKNVSNMLKPNGQFCFTTNDQSSFKELFQLFEMAFSKLDINPKPLQEYQKSRSSIKLLKDQLEKYGLTPLKQLNQVSYLRFVSSEALFNHSLIRIAFLSTWKSLIPEEKWNSFRELISTYMETIIAQEGEFKISIPIVYLDFKKL